MNHAITIILAVMVTLSAWAQGEISIFSCESKIIAIPRSVVSPPPTTEKNEVGLVVYYIGSRLGEIRLAEDQFSKLIENAQAEDKCGAPLFGPGYEYMIRDGKGRHFIVQERAQIPYRLPRGDCTAGRLGFEGRSVHWRSLRRSHFR